MFYRIALVNSKCIYIRYVYELFCILVDIFACECFVFNAINHFDPTWTYVFYLYVTSSVSKLYIMDLMQNTDINM